MLGLRRLPRHRRPAALHPGRREQHPHTPQDRRGLLPISPAERADAPAYQPGHGRRGATASPSRRRPDGAAEAGLGLRPSLHVLRDPGLSRLVRLAAPLRRARRGALAGRRRASASCSWSAENSTSYGKDLGDLRLLETLLPELAAVDGVERVRVSYLQPAETRPGLVTAIASTPGVAPYFDLSFQHASGPVLRRMRRFGDAEAFLGLLDQARARRPRPERGRTSSSASRGDRATTSRSCATSSAEARLDAIGIFGYSDEDGTEAERLRRQARRGRDRRAGRARDRAGRGAHRPARRGADRRDRRGAGRVRRGRRRRGTRGAPGAGGRRVDRCWTGLVGPRGGR